MNMSLILAGEKNPNLFNFAGVDDEHNIVDRDAGLCDVGGEDLQIEMRLFEMFSSTAVCVKLIEVRGRDTHDLANTFRSVLQNLLLV